MRSDPVAGSSIRTSTGPRWGANSAVKSRRTADSSPVDGASTYSGINTSRESYRTPRTIEPSPARRSDDAIDTGATPNPVLPYKCSTGSAPERPSSTPDHPGQTTRQENQSPYASNPPLPCIQSALTTLTNLQPTDNLILIQTVNTTINHNRATAREVLLSQRMHRRPLSISQHRLRLTRLINRQAPRIVPTALIVQERLHQAAIGVTTRPVPTSTKGRIPRLRVMNRRQHVRQRVPNIIRSPRITIRIKRGLDNLHQPFRRRAPTGIAVPVVDRSRVAAGLLVHAPHH